MKKRLIVEFLILLFIICIVINAVATEKDFIILMATSFCIIFIIFMCLTKGDFYRFMLVCLIGLLLLASAAGFDYLTKIIANTKIQHFIVELASVLLVSIAFTIRQIAEENKDSLIKSFLKNFAFLIVGVFFVNYSILYLK